MPAGIGSDADVVLECGYRWAAESHHSSRNLILSRGWSCETKCDSNEVSALTVAVHLLRPVAAAHKPWIKRE